MSNTSFHGALIASNVGLRDLRAATDNPTDSVGQTLNFLE